jgi:hypothetical protein
MTATQDVRGHLRVPLGADQPIGGAGYDHIQKTGLEMGPFYHVLSILVLQAFFPNFPPRSVLLNDRYCAGFNLDMDSVLPPL